MGIQLAEGTYGFALRDGSLVLDDAGTSDAAERILVHDTVQRQLEHVAAYVGETRRPHRFVIYAREPVGAQFVATVEPDGDHAGRITIRRDADGGRDMGDTNTIRAALEAVRDVVLVTEAEPFPPRIVFANSAFTRMTGYALDEIIGRTPKILQGPGTDPTTQAYIRSRLRQWLPARAELVNYRKDGSEFWVELDIAPVADESGWYTHWIAIQRETSERRQREEAALVAGRMEVVSLLAGGIAHDVGNVLASVLAATGQMERVLARSPADATERTRDAVRAINDAVRHGRTLTKQLLDVARGARSVVEPVQLARVVGEMASLGRMGSALEVLVDADPAVWVQGDVGQLGQIVLNLVVNARGAMPDGGTLHITLTTEDVSDDDPRPLAAGRYAKLVVRDEGVGIPRENLTRIFDPYFTTKAEGTGLGLSVVYVLTKRLGGHVSVRSELGELTEFTVLLPAVDEPTA